MRGAEIVPVAIARRAGTTPAACTARSCCSRPRATWARCRSASARSCHAALNAALDEGRAIDASRLSRRRSPARAARSRSAPDWLGRLRRRASRRRRRRPRRGASPSTGDPSCCTLASLLGSPAITLPVGLRRGGCRSACSFAAPRNDDERCWPSRRGARRGSRSGARVDAALRLRVDRDMKRAKKHPPPVPKPRNPVARSPLLGKGGPHGKSTRARSGRAGRTSKLREKLAMDDPHAR